MQFLEVLRIRSELDRGFTHVDRNVAEKRITATKGTYILRITFAIITMFRRVSTMTFMMLAAMPNEQTTMQT